MCRILLIDEYLYTRRPNLEIDNIATVVNDGHEFSEREQLEFNILDIPGIDKWGFQEALRPTVKLVSGLNADLFTPPEETKVFYDGAKWMELAQKPRHEFSFNNITTAERTELSEVATSKSRKLEILSKLSPNVITHPDNQVEFVGFDGVGDYEVL